MFYVRQAYPTFATRSRPSLWSLAHGISRQESSFDPYAVSHAGARGMMQLMTGTAREQAGKIGVGFDSSRLISDPSYNVMLGSAYFQRMLNIWDGSFPLAVASYNAGSGNVGKWVAPYGDPRGQVDMLKWIEEIPYVETRGYVQRVIENSVVYDLLRGGAAAATGDARLALSWEEPARADSRRVMSDPPPRFITPHGFARIRAEYDELFGGERPKIVEIVSWAAALGDRSENGDYLYGKQAPARDRPPARHLAKIMKAAKVVDPATQADRDQVRFGATVELADEDDERRTLTIVGDDEADAGAGGSAGARRSPARCRREGRRRADRSPAGGREKLRSDRRSAIRIRQRGRALGRGAAARPASLSTQASAIAASAASAGVLFVVAVDDPPRRPAGVGVGAQLVRAPSDRPGRRRRTAASRCDRAATDCVAALAQAPLLDLGGRRSTA